MQTTDGQPQGGVGPPPSNDGVPARPLPPVPVPAQPLARLALLVAACAAYGVLVLANNYALTVWNGGEFTAPAAVLSVSRGLQWVVLIPAIIWFARFAPRNSWLVLLAAHATFAVLLICLTELAHTALASALYGGVDDGFYWRSLVSAALLHLTAYSLVAAAAHGRDWLVEAARSTRLEAELVRAQLEALRAQLHPHVLFNTLEAVSSLVGIDARRARRMIADLGELLRFALDATADEVPLRDELGALRRYLHIESARLGDRLRVQVEAAAPVLDAAVPPLLLQPLVENAVRHGVAPFPGAGSVEVEAVREGDNLVVRVHDTGPGLPPEPSRPRGRGIGLENTRRRLDRLYGASAALGFETPRGGGLTVTVRLPFRRLTPTTSHTAAP